MIPLWGSPLTCLGGPHLSIWSDATLATDDDLTKIESGMPDYGKAAKNPSGTASAYDGKRDLAKTLIAKWIDRHGYMIEGIKEPSEFSLAAIYLELSLIYEDLSRRGDSMAADKAVRYTGKYEDEIEEIRITYVDPGTVDGRSKLGGIPLWRG